MEVTSATTTAPAASGSAAGLAETFDNFLTLLTAQLKNQDPLSPLDTNQFTDQLVQFTNVEQAIKTNDKLDALIALQGANQLTASLGYIGKLVEVDGVGLGLNDGSATMVYDLSANAAALSIEILDENGETVRHMSGPSSSGRHEVVWDGKDDAGADLPDGSYQFVVSATDAQGDSVALTQGSYGRVTGVEVIGGIVTLSLGGMKVTLSQVISVKEDLGDEG